MNSLNVSKRCYFCVSGSRLGGEVHVPHAVPNDSRFRGEIPDRRHEGVDFRANSSKPRYGASGWRLGHPQPLPGQARPVPMQNL